MKRQRGWGIMWLWIVQRCRARIRSFSISKAKSLETRQSANYSLSNWTEKSQRNHLLKNSLKYWDRKTNIAYSTLAWIRINFKFFKNKSLYSLWESKSKSTLLQDQRYDHKQTLLRSHKMSLEYSQFSSTNLTTALLRKRTKTCQLLGFEKL